MNNVYGIDIAKKSFESHADLASDSSIKKSYANTEDGHYSFISNLAPGSLCVMEASGPYYLNLACRLVEAGVKVSVVNPLVIRRYSQMQLRRTKTDQVDAELIAQYARQYQDQLRLWEPPKQVFLQLQQISTSLTLLEKQLQMLKNQQEAMAQIQTGDPVVKQEQNQLIEGLKSSMKKLEKQQLHLSKTHFKDTYKSLISIPGIGPKTATLLICITHNFTRFESAKQLVAYVGLCPRIFRSGSSVHGKERIVKMGQTLARKYLYMGAFSAMRVNPLCEKMVANMKSKGKHYRVIRVAVAHKLLRQAFALAKSGAQFNPEFL